MATFNPAHPPPLFAGQPLFGELDNFVQFPLEQPSVEFMQDFLGQSVQYGPSPGTRLFAVTGQWIGRTEDEVANQEAKLLSFVGEAQTYRRPTGDIFPATVQILHNCYFSAEDFAPDPSGIQSLGINRFGLRFSLILREIPLT